MGWVTRRNWFLQVKLVYPPGVICLMSTPFEYLFQCARRKFRSNKKIRRKLLIVYVYYQPNSCTAPATWMGWRNLSKTAEKKFHLNAYSYVQEENSGSNRKLVELTSCLHELPTKFLHYTCSIDGLEESF